ncbi:hypothetical protein SAMN05444000_12075 [Shimia gijangensis]|uniref:DUF6455 domain-containing protein n=1 Tax=Shimia gijangensis TaxID=1470563 RepID=A0A1M6Q8P4_9RHOB|nr:DUF6455 family protein [Shimia gijangensis]SHK16654.1 hypothetical protein SAMN05444000_12075 [Shimia gijangensis]
MSNVTPLGDPARHFWMTRSVARAMGVSLSEAMAEDRLSHRNYADLVTRCRQCHFVQECENWLSRQVDRADCAPGCCQHAALFDSLKDVARKA